MQPFLSPRREGAIVFGEERTAKGEKRVRKRKMAKIEILR